MLHGICTQYARVENVFMGHVEFIFLIHRFITLIDLNSLHISVKVYACVKKCRILFIKEFHIHVSIGTTQFGGHFGPHHWRRNLSRQTRKGHVFGNRCFILCLKNECIGFLDVYLHLLAKTLCGNIEHDVLIYKHHTSLCSCFTFL